MHPPHSGPPGPTRFHRSRSTPCSYPEPGHPRNRLRNHGRTHCRTCSSCLRDCAPSTHPQAFEQRSRSHPERSDQASRKSTPTFRPQSFASSGLHKRYHSTPLGTPCGARPSHAQPTSPRTPSPVRSNGSASGPHPRFPQQAYPLGYPSRPLHRELARHLLGLLP